MENSKKLPPRRGMAIFAVLSLMVVFTVLGVAAITMAQRDNAASGNVFDIKQREAAAYAGLVYAQNELARDPANFVALLESWRTKTVYGGSSAPYPPLYLKFDAATKVQLTKTKPSAFTIPGTTSNILVEVVGITLPSTSAEEPRIALRSTGSGSSGDEQTLLGVYSIKNIRVTSGSATMPITHPLYIGGGGDWNYNLTVSNGPAYLGNSTHINSSVTQLNITNSGGLRVNGDFGWDNMDKISISGNTYINGTFKANGKATLGADFLGNLVITGDMEYTGGPCPVTVGKSLYILGPNGIKELKGNHVKVGTAGANSFLAIANGELSTLDPNGWMEVIGSACLRNLRGDPSKSWALDVSDRLELSSTAPNPHTFTGEGRWGRLVSNAAPAGSYLKEGAPVIAGRISGMGTNGIRILGGAGIGHSWRAGSNLTVGTGTNKATLNAGTFFDAELAGGLNFSGTGTLTTGTTRPTDLTGVVNASGFETSLAPPDIATGLGMGLPPTATNDAEPQVDFATDPTALNKAWTPTGSALCKFSGICGASMNKAYADNIAAGSPNFHNGFFVVKLSTFPKWEWDLSGTKTSMLKGKFLFIVQGDIAGGDNNPWPTSDINPAPPAKPTNVIFIYVATNPNLASPYKIFDGFSPRYLNDKTTPLTFTGYIRLDVTTTPTVNSISWTPIAPVNYLGAFHVVGDRDKLKFTINSGSAGVAPTFTFNQAALDVIGTAFGTNFVIGGKNLGLPAGQFLLLENWIQFRTLGELR